MGRGRKVPKKSVGSQRVHSSVEGRQSGRSEGAQSGTGVLDETPYEVKVSRTVWGGGKGRDHFKTLPITMIMSYQQVSSLESSLGLKMLKALSLAV